MTVAEIKSKGNFDTWDETRLNEIKAGNFSFDIGQMLYENAEITLWQIELKPFERLPFRAHTNNYSCTCLSEGLALSRNVDGRIILIRMEKGDYFYKECSENEMISDFENVGEDSIKIAIVEEKLKLAPKSTQ